MHWQDVNAALGILEKVYPDQVLFCKEVSSVPFEPVHLSTIDYFHPSIAGQKRLAEVSWNKDWIMSSTS
jgi:hypothetical protein